MLLLNSSVSAAAVSVRMQFTDSPSESHSLLASYREGSNCRGRVNICVIKHHLHFQATLLGTPTQSHAVHSSAACSTFKTFIMTISLSQLYEMLTSEGGCFHSCLFLGCFISRIILRLLWPCRSGSRTPYIYGSDCTMGSRPPYTCGTEIKDKIWCFPCMLSC